MDEREMNEILREREADLANAINRICDSVAKILVDDSKSRHPAFSVEDLEALAEQMESKPWTFKIGPLHSVLTGKE